MTGIKHWTLRKWSKRFDWEAVPKHAQALDASKLSKSASAHDETLDKINKSAHFHYAVAALKAGVKASELTGDELMDRNTALAFNQNTQAADRALGWTASRQQPTAQIAIQVNMPTPEEMAQRDADHKRMDLLTAQLRLMQGEGGSPPATDAP